MCRLITFVLGALPILKLHIIAWWSVLLLVFARSKQGSGRISKWNELVWSDKHSTAAGVSILAQTTLSSWPHAQDKVLVPTATFLIDMDGLETWQKPVDMKLKVNVDAATFDSSGTYSFMCVARDANGDLVEAIIVCRAGNMSPKLAEAMGVREALSWVKKSCH
ncbi:uncharacterized protein LOC133030635 [Cannabis sativa]|uniref:uncharacterized protein LOC133030635 n=1 Tax=Cannabis sativa TaxID=3483 RepID=UPI0029CA2698|nr:uncharacterized protein LOC133030635 [Cannabis sativa]